MKAEIVEGENCPDSLRGKIVEFDVSSLSDWTEMPDCISIVKATPPADAPLLPVPEGLSQCPVCNEYRGVMALKEIPNLLPSYRNENPDTPLRIQCICDGVLCPGCKTNRYHRPTTNVWAERGGFLHVPQWRASFPCDECNEKREANAAAVRKMNIARRRELDDSNLT
jgi:hypothetical protein